MPNELKPCPFCGNMPYQHPETKRIWCDTNGCIGTAILAINTDEWNIRHIENALQARIDELESLKCSCCADPITTDDNDSNLCGACADSLKEERDRLLERNTELQARIAELEQQLETAKAHAIVWHKYPDEKPEKPKNIGMWMNVLVIDSCRTYWIGTCRFIGNKLDMISPQSTTHWAYLPAPPKEGE